MAVSSDAAGSASGNSDAPLPSVDGFPSGYYFVPRDDEALLYLRRKILGQQLPFDIIQTADIYGTSHDQLPFENSRYLRDNEWYFFTRRSHQPVTEDGYWIRGADKEIDVNGHVEGFKQELVYYLGMLGSGERTPWRIWEYRMNPYAIGSPNELDDDVKEKIENLVMCKVFLNELRPTLVGGDCDRVHPGINDEDLMN